MIGAHRKIIASKVIPENSISRKKNDEKLKARKNRLQELLYISQSSFYVVLFPFDCTSVFPPPDNRRWASK